MEASVSSLGFDEYSVDQVWRQIQLELALILNLYLLPSQILHRSSISSKVVLPTESDAITRVLDLVVL